MTEHEGRADEAVRPDEREELDELEDRDYVPGGRRRKGRGLKGCVAVLVALVVLLGGFYVALTQGVSWVADQFQGPDDYPGPGTGSVEFTVNEGDSTAQIGRNLKADGVTKSVQAFIDAAAGEPDAAGIQVGAYELQKEMKAADALEVLIDPDNLIGFPTVTIPEGLRLTEIVSTLAQNTDFPERAWNRALQQPDRLGLPDYAEGNAEGYLFPATYEVKPGMKPVRILKMMVDRWREAADAAGLEERAAELGKTPGELMIIASLIEAEGRGDDMPKISRVIYNRLDGPGDKGGTNGTLGIDASIAYGLGLSPGSTELTPEQLAEDTPYNTRINAGLPPTPIEAPGDDAIAAAANPADGPWYYYVTVNLETGETKFYEDYDDFLVGRDEYKTYCETSDRC
ncbi:endolytic transglycosylase MltG [uncultured Nocardioides sp.]|uniref:endolytic transglycosylase MltG n=1 Tax=Nocardioides sp. T5 TaxID=3400182 RepID=UPI0026029E60|nr:endolytic transglycosylase MltG [uncultured Nocardioides sp.]